MSSLFHPLKELCLGKWLVGVLSLIHEEVGSLRELVNPEVVLQGGHGVHLSLL